LIVRTDGENSVLFSLNNLLEGFSSVTLLVFLGGFSLFAGVGIVSACPKVSNDFKVDVFEVDPFSVITYVPFPTYKVLAFASTRSGTKFEYSFDFPSAFRYLARLFLVTTWEAG